MLKSYPCPIRLQEQTTVLMLIDGCAQCIIERHLQAGQVDRAAEQCGCLRKFRASSYLWSGHKALIKYDLQAQRKT